MHLLRKLVFVLGVSLVLVSQAQALGVGGSELHSALNQPLKADIELTNLGDLQEDDIVVSLAANADFERAGIDRLMFYSQLNFELLLNHETGPKIRVTTRGPVREPYLNFLLELRWASGRLIREYTFLLDLPTFDDEAGATVSQAVEAAGRSTTGSDERQSSRSSVSAAPREDSQRQARSGSAVSGRSYGPVGSNDTLWEIALQVRPDRDLSVQQTMLALQRKNPEAFINGNINLLRAGQILRLPDRQEIQTVGQRQAVNQVAQQNRDWSSNQTGAQLDASGRQTNRRATDGKPEGQLRLAAPAQETANKTGQGGGSNQGEGQALSSELTATQEELDKTRRENRELSARVQDLESQIGTMERLIAASNEQLRALQMASGQNRQEQLSNQDALPEDPSVNQSMTEPQSQPADSAQQDAAIEDQSAPKQSQAEQTSESEQTDKRVVRSVPQSKSWLDLMMDNVLWVALAALAVLLSIYYGYRRRNQQRAATGDQDPLASDELDSEEPFALGPDQDGDYEQELTYEEDIASDGDGYQLEEDEAKDSQDQVEAETGDAVAEADIYIAYGKLDQAEELLLNELTKDPQAPAVLTKLLELYLEKQDVESFDQHYATLLGTNDPAAIQRGGELRDLLPGAGPFDASALEQSPGELEDTSPNSDQAIDLGEDDEDFDFDFNELDGDLDSSEPQAEKLETDTQTGDQGEEQDVDFDLDPDFDFDLGELDEDAEQHTEPSPNDKDSLIPDQEPSAESDQEPSAESDQEPSAESDQEPSAESDQEPSAESDQEPSADLDQEPSADIEQKSSVDSDQEPAPTNEEEPVYELDTEDDDFSFDWEDASTKPKDLDTDSGSIKDDFPDLDISLDELPTGEEETVTDSGTEEPEPESEQGTDGDTLDDWDLEIEPDEQSLSALDHELSSLDRLDDSADQTQDEQQTQHKESVAAESQAAVDPTQSQVTEQPPEANEQPPEATDGVTEEHDEESVFEEALSGLDAQEESQAEDQDQAPEGAFEEGQTNEEKSEEAMDEELDFLADTDEAATKLDLAQAYIDMGDADGARDILEEVAQEGDDKQRQEAQELLGRIDN